MIQRLFLCITVGFMTTRLLLAADPQTPNQYQSDKRLLADAERIISPMKTVMEKPPNRVPSRDTVNGPLIGNGDLGAVISGPPSAQKYWISKNNFWRLKDGHRQGGPRLFGGLDIDIPALSNAAYRVEQHIFPAITISKFADNKCTVTLRSLTTATADFILVEISVDGDPVDVTGKLWSARGRGSKEEAGFDKSMLWTTKAFEQDVKIPTAAGCAMSILGAKDPAFGVLPGQTATGVVFRVLPGKPVTVAVAMQSSFDAKDPLAAAKEMISGLNNDKLKDLMAKHTQWWREFWSHSLVEFDHKDLMKTYYLSSYMMGSGTRDKDFPAGLFGLWVTSDDPRWAGDYHLNFDYQSQYYGLYKCNLLEQADTCEQPVLDFIERGKWYAKNCQNMRGVYYPVGIGAKGIDTSMQAGRVKPGLEEGGCFMGQKCNAAYCAINMAMRWYHTYDLDYAKKVYPFMVELINFWEDYLRFEPSDTAKYPPLAETDVNSFGMPNVMKIDGVPVDKIQPSKLPPGRYVIYKDSIQENSGNDVNPLLGLGLVYNAFELILDMSKELGVDADRRERWEHIFKNLSKPATFEKDGKTVFRYGEKGTAWIDGNSVGLQHIYPSGMVGLDDGQKLLEISRNTINAAGRNWNGDNGNNSHYPAAARMGYEPAVLLDRLAKLVAPDRTAQNGLPDTMEQCSTCPNTINEMICMSHRQVLRLFPVWPKDKDVRFWNLRAEGAFLVSSQFKGGVVKYVRVLSEKGRDCTVVNPWPGKGVDVYRDGKKVETLKGERFVMKTQPGAIYMLGPEGSGEPSE